MSKEAYLLMACIKSLRGSWGMNMSVDVLRGSRVSFYAMIIVISTCNSGANALVKVHALSTLNLLILVVSSKDLLISFKFSYILYGILRNFKSFTEYFCLIFIFLFLFFNSTNTILS